MGQGRVKAIGFTRKENRRALAHAARKKRKLEEKKKGIKVIRIPRTIDNSRILDQSYIHEKNEEEMLKEDMLDEFAPILNGKRNPKVMITTTLGAGSYSIKFGYELVTVIPRAMFRRRRGFALHTILKQLKRKDFTALIIIEQGGKSISLKKLYISNIFIIFSCKYFIYFFIFLFICQLILKGPDGLWIIGLPFGPTAHFRIASVRYRREVPV